MEAYGNLWRHEVKVVYLRDSNSAELHDSVHSMSVRSGSHVSDILLNDSYGKDLLLRQLERCTNIAIA